MIKFVPLRWCAVILAISCGLAVAGDRPVDSGKKPSRGVQHFEPPRYSPGLQRLPERSRDSSRATATRQAEDLLSVAAKQPRDEAIATLQRIFRSSLPSSQRNDEILAEAYHRLADLHREHPARRLLSLALAMQFEPSADKRASIEKEILEAGGNPMVATFRASPGNAYARRDPGVDDSCAGAISVTLPHMEVMHINPVGDHNWRAFELPGPFGHIVRIETISDFPGTGFDDTDLALWDGCPGQAHAPLYFNEDKPSDFTSIIVTDCVPPGPYYAEIGGFHDEVTADNFRLEIESLSTCIVPTLDDFEPDRWPFYTAAPIGHPTSNPSAHGWGRARREIQQRSIFPINDEDNAKFRLTRNERVRIGTQRQFPTFFNNFDGSAPSTNSNTEVGLSYESRFSYLGRCNRADDDYFPVCHDDSDCPPDTPRIYLPATPNDQCIPPYWFYGDFYFLEGWPFRENDDRSAYDRGSEVSICLPASGPGTPSLTLQRWGGDYIVHVKRPWGSSGTFSYELQVKNEVTCLFEQEPNNAFEDATPIDLGTVVAGFYDFAVTNPYADVDLYRFDVDEPTEIVFETLAGNPVRSDTAIQIFAGPDDFGQFFLVAEDEDGGPDLLSRLELTLPPARDLMNGVASDAAYYVNVTSSIATPNFPYELRTTIVQPHGQESEPNDSDESATPIEMNQILSARINAGCDVDVYRFDLLEETFVTLDVPAGGDTAIELVSCDEPGSVLTCDDDGAGSMRSSIDGCLPAGSYCARVRAFSGADTFAYELALSGTTGCAPTDPPSLSGDRSFTCLAFQTCP